ncbi:MAG: acyl-CoA dehydrogenase family protein [Myxococcales bacterium]|nr:acyl-CoA dehydrogenase family protein [Myxococcales bacterium]MCB9532376.1 acyl-CoA dehydrogenase family protein [Myxococcales bacterium]
MDLKYTPEDEAFRAEAAGWLREQLEGPFAHVRWRGGPGDEHALVEERRDWARAMGAAGWSCIDWPAEHGGRGASIMQQVIFNEEYARLGGPGRLGHIGETLAGPTILAFGTDEQKARLLPPIRSGDVIWCQGYSEPNAGSDLANVQTRAERRPDGTWSITGQKTWTSHAHIADWCFVVCRTDGDPTSRHRGLSYILVPMHQPGIEIRPIRQMTGTSEFNEVFFEDARASADDVVGEVGGGWRIAMATLAFERGASTLGQQLAFETELRQIIDLAKTNGAARDPSIRARIADAWVGLRVMRLNALRMLTGGRPGELSREATVSKLYWATWHRALGELAMDVRGDDAERIEGRPYELDSLQRMALFSRSDTIYAGSNEIQRNIIAERALGLPR